ncbi:MULTISPECIES: ribokinase [unclassified Nocardioides]|uniref:ribokinase n=1 Tax=unclassified Nocardioides TaxID=2615069 RepID=UPI0009EFD964|nr:MULTISPECIES: ribokinase [unclassified Nocardioides]GAW51287.1 Putative ribokinase [Nocardioides sp. PD653-B2]GAW52634.1 putative ribokinase [Nocardioides sp. PD653]
MTGPQPRVVVLGSLNMDTVVGLERRPEPGETVLSASVRRSAGGKGLNQAVAASRAGAPTTMIGGVGDDRDGAELREALTRYGVDATHVRTLPEQSTGSAFITVTEDGENAIVVLPGSNGALDSDCLAPLRALPPGSVLLCQLEVPLATVLAAATIAADQGVRVILNASPVTELPQDLLRLCDPLVVNAREALRLLGDDERDVAGSDDLRQLSSDLLGLGAQSVVVTWGAGGAVWRDHQRYLTAPAPRVAVADTTGAGDAFAGTLAADLLAGRSADQALASATAAGSEATTWHGAHP